MRRETLDNKLPDFRTFRFFSFFLLTFSLSSCSKVDYNQLNKPAYLRVFNDFDYILTVENKEDLEPFFTMLIEPEFDASGLPVGAETVGDFLDKRDPYAPPYPSHVGSSINPYNPEYPGKANVLVGPVLNGFDLSSWAQVPSGKKRVVFFYRPVNEIPFFQLEDRLRRNILLDTVLNLDAGEVYTLHILQKDFNTRESGLLLRQEIFHKLPLSDSLVYVNFYNLSAKGFWDSDNGLKPRDFRWGLLQNGIRDEMNVYYTLLTGSGAGSAFSGYDRNYMTSIRRNTETADVASYNSFPLFADPASDGISTNMWQHFELLVPGADIHFVNVGSGGSDTHGTYADFICQTGAVLPNLLVNIHSGIYNPRSFATVNTIEIVNGKAYLTTIQRKYAPPAY